MIDQVIKEYYIDEKPDYTPDLSKRFSVVEYVFTWHVPKDSNPTSNGHSEQTTHAYFSTVVSRLG